MQPKLVIQNIETRVVEQKLQNNETELVVASETKAISTPSVMVGGNAYGSIAEAIAAANEGDTVVLVKDVDVATDPIEYNKDYSITFDSQGHSIAGNFTNGMEFKVTGTGIILGKNMSGISFYPNREYKKVAIVVTSLDGSAKSDVVYATLCECETAM